MPADPLLALLDASSTRAALVVPDDGTSRSHAELTEAAAVLAGALAAAGVGRGDRVAAVLGNGPEPVVLLFALGLLGAAMAPLNAAYTEAELRFFLEDIRPRLLPLGADVPEGGAGEVAIRGPGVTPGYLGNAAANAASFFGGWFRTGDEGALEDGSLRLRGRLKKLMLRGGENISPYEIEAVLQSHPQVAEAVAFGVDDAKYGQTVAAAVVLHGAGGADELREHARRSLAAFKVPERIHVLDEIPKTPTGKVQRPRMAALLEDDPR